jgi:hypothetical protein
MTDGVIVCGTDCGAISRQFGDSSFDATRLRWWGEFEMKVGAFAACAKTGFVVQHAAACEDVAQNANSIILFREPGMMAQTLIAEGYSMKGFRIDTKSCNWGPMAGFVCADPNLTKDPAYAARNKVWTSEALSGHIVEKFFGKVQDAE